MQTIRSKQRSLHTTAAGDYSSMREMLDSAVLEAVSSTEPETLRNALLHASTGGKRIRPMLTLISCEAVGGHAHAAMDAAVAMELLHTSSLIHDDIMDRSRMRRGRTAIHSHFGTSMAILAGDMLLALAFTRIARLEARSAGEVLNIISRAFADTCEGQAYDISNSSIPESLSHLRMVEKKTARLIEAAATLGGLLGGARGGALEALKGFGLNIGMAYQVKDDLLDVVALEEQTEKSTGVDQRNGRVTFASQLSSNEVGSLNGVAEEYTERAFEYLNLLPDTRHRKMLRALAGSLVGRSN